MDAWLSPRGTFYPVGAYCHYAFEQGWHRRRQMENFGPGLYGKGWAKLSRGEWFDGITGPTQSQVDAIFDWHRANDRTFDNQRFEVDA